jgi:hypothetical protein
MDMRSNTPSRRRSPLLWFFEPFERDPTYTLRLMFGCDAAYIDGLLCLVMADQNEPWNGLMVCTSKDRHAELIEEFPVLRPHPVLGKWLYVSQTAPGFEAATEKLVAQVLARDLRIGVVPKPRRRKPKSA